MLGASLSINKQYDNFFIWSLYEVAAAATAAAAVEAEMKYL